MIIALGESSSAHVGFSPDVRQILIDFSDIVSNELPDELPPLRDIHHAIYFMLWSSLSNLPHHRMNLIEHVELRRHIH